MSDISVAAYIQSLLDSPKLSVQITSHRIIPGSPADFGANCLRWSAGISRLLDDRDIRLYSHQALATDHVRAGKSIVASTPTASGKSLIYNLPVLEQHLRDPDATALYLFPLKALAQDQLWAFNALSENWPQDARPEAAIYDGDTPEYRRRKIRQNPPTALITNPEMLHLAILPYHNSWSTFLANLSHVIVDEAHTYRGVFGAHMAQVFRRLNRIAGRYGANPTYIFCTATLGNPLELASSLMGKPEPVVLIDKSGAPQGKRHFLFFNPDQAASSCAIELLKRSLEYNLRTIVYCRTRRMTELISIWAGSESGPFKNKISSYRAGYLAEERREIEAKMASGELMAVVSTSALELGIDIGGLDVCILVGYPGTVTQTLQRGGRVGRAGQEAAVLMVAGDDALDQYFARHPDDFFNRPPEKATVNPFNPVIMERHLECAAAEFPLMAADPWLQHDSAKLAINNLREAGLLALSADGLQWLASRKRPQRQIDLRGSGQSYSLEDKEGTLIGQMDAFRAWKETHPGAVYLHRGKSFIVSEIDTGRRRILLEPAKVGWFTRARVKKETIILKELARKSVGRCAVFKGRLRISEQITGYEKRITAGNKLLNITPLDAPLQVFETDGFWFVIPDEIRQALESRFLHFMGSIHALEHAMIGLLPLEVMADRNDFGGISIPLHYQLGLPAVFIYDALPGGAGLCHAAYENAERVLLSTFKAISGCFCTDGCPSCIQSPKCGAGNRPLSKQGAVELLAEMLEKGPEGVRICNDLEISPPHDFDLLEAPSVPCVQTADCKPTENCSCAFALQAGPPENYIVFDVETRRSAREVGGWSKADKMGVSIAVIYESKTGEFISYQQDELGKMLDKLAGADLVIGFNSLRFDYKVLQPFAANGQLLSALPSLDLLQKIYEKLSYRISLDNLCKATLDTEKSSDGLQALKWWKEGKIDEIAAYCQKDVELTRDLYLFGLREGFIFYTNKAGSKVRLDIDFGLKAKMLPIAKQEGILP